MIGENRSLYFNIRLFLALLFYYSIINRLHMTRLIFLRPATVFGAFADRWKLFIGFGLGFFVIGIKTGIVEGGFDGRGIGTVGQELDLDLSL